MTGAPQICPVARVTVAHCGIASRDSGRFDAVEIATMRYLRQAGENASDGAAA